MKSKTRLLYLRCKIKNLRDIVNLLGMTFPFSLWCGYHSHSCASVQHGLSTVSIYVRLLHSYLDTGNGSFNPPCRFSPLSPTMSWFAFLLFFPLNFARFGHGCVELLAPLKHNVSRWFKHYQLKVKTKTCKRETGHPKVNLVNHVKEID